MVDVSDMWDDDEDDDIVRRGGRRYGQENEDPIDIHLMETQHPPFQVGQLVRLANYPYGKVYYVVGAVYDYKDRGSPPWTFHIVTGPDMRKGHPVAKVCAAELIRAA